MKRALLLTAALLLLWQSVALAQQREPLAMRIEFEWTVLGVVSGAVVGAMLWLTDPANPNNVFSDQTSQGAAWGAIIGAGFGVYVMQRTAQFPTPLAGGPRPGMPPLTSTDPVAAMSGERRGLQVSAGGSPGIRGILMPIFNVRF